MHFTKCKIIVNCTVINKEALVLSHMGCSKSPNQCYKILVVHPQESVSPSLCKDCAYISPHIYSVSIISPASHPTHNFFTNCIVVIFCLSLTGATVKHNEPIVLIKFYK
ncbi:hypothetical protein KIL84_016856 [Mauremys mutica]|uniref:Uncharacterized protein n=1 Tax=Mauremys mutica TaxID=74926 RepID=A0A9D3X3R5_9SAUR|nr:hypothetical protein KIL84_016856 [Mauremys mutica]